jgi:trk system potassium uptake protein TrkA
MKVVVIGCGRVGAKVAAELAARGETVSVVDIRRSAFSRLPATFSGLAITGSGTDADVLQSAGADTADLVMALTEGDNRNVLAAQLAKHTFGVPRVVAKINDPLRAEAYRTLGLETICRTVVLADALIASVAGGVEATNGMVLPPTAEPMLGAPPAGSLADDQARAAADQMADEG